MCTSPRYHTRQLVAAALTAAALLRQVGALVLCPGFSRADASARASSHLASAGVSHAACDGLRGTTKGKSRPRSTVGIPSTRNSHCQPRRPATLSSERKRMASGPPMIPLVHDPRVRMLYACPNSAPVIHWLRNMDEPG